MANEKRLIDVDKAKKDFNLHFGGVSHAVIANRILDEQPTVDAVEVVRCKDCKWYEANCETCVLHSDDGDTYDFGYDVNMKPDDFCSYGERKDNGQISKKRHASKTSGYVLWEMESFATDCSD